MQPVPLFFHGIDMLILDEFLKSSIKVACSKINMNSVTWAMKLKKDTSSIIV